MLSTPNAHQVSDLDAHTLETISKGRRRQTVYMPPPALDRLLAWLRAAPESVWLFPFLADSSKPIDPLLYDPHAPPRCRRLRTHIDRVFG